MKLNNNLTLLMLSVMIGELLCEKENLNGGLSKFLDDKFKSISSEISKTIIHEDRLELLPDKFKFEFNVNNSISGSELIFINHQLYVISNLNIIHFNNRGGNELQLVKANPYFSLRNADILFTRVYNSFLSVGFSSGFIDLFELKNDVFHYIQTIRTTLNLKDATFHYRKKEVYLIVLDDFIITYKWNEAHFDEISKLNFGLHANIKSFGNDFNDLVITLDNTDNRQLRNNFYLFDGENLILNQYLYINNATEAAFFEFEGSIYVVVFGITSALYKWDGLDLYCVGEYNFQMAVTRSVVTYYDEWPLLFITDKDKIKAFIFVNDNFKELHLEEKTFTQILDMQIVNNKLYVYTKDGEIARTISLYSYNVSLTNSKGEENSDQTHLSQCFSQLEKELMMKKKHNIIKRESLTQKVNLSEMISQARVVTPDSISQASYRRKIQDFSNSLKHIFNYIGFMKVRVSELFNTNNLVIKEHFTVSGNLNSKNLKVNNIKLATLNGLPWTPENWLTVNSAQTITNTAMIETLYCNNINVRAPDNIFQGLITRTGEQNIYIKNINSINASKIYTPKINKIMFDKLYFKNFPRKILGKKTFKEVHSNKFEVAVINNVPAPDIVQLLGGYKQMGSTTFVKTLKFKTINGKTWDTFRKSLLLKDKPFKITGNVTVQNLNVSELNALSLAGLKTKSFLTISTNQNVTSTIHFKKLHAKNITADLVNGLELEKEVAVYNSTNNIIYGPISIQLMDIVRSLRVSGDMDTGTLRKFDNHLVGSSQTEQLQIYEKPVKIIGNVTIQNINVPSSSRIFVKKQIFDPNIFMNYWSKTKYQTIPVFFEAKNGISCPHLTTVLLNDVKLSDYILRNSNAELFTNFYFENMEVLGNVHLSSEKVHIPNLNKIDQESVKFGRSYVIKGKKVFMGNLTIDDLTTSTIDGANVSLAILKNSFDLSGINSFEKIILNGDLSCTEADVDILNEIPLTTIHEKAIMIDEPQKITKLNFQEIRAKNIFVHTLNGCVVSDYISDLRRIDDMKLLSNVIVNGNLIVNGDINSVEYINDMKLSELQQKCLSEMNEEVYENITFAENINTNQIEVLYVNNINLDLLQTILNRNMQQSIFGVYTFKHIKANNVLTPVINGKNIENVVDVRSKTPITLRAKSFHFTEAIFKNSIESTCFACNVSEALSKLNSPKPRKWREIIVLKDVQIHDNNTVLGKIVSENGYVNRLKQNVITAPVTFNQLKVENLFSRKNINDVNIKDIVENAVLKSKDMQVITGHKHFINLEGEQVFVATNMNISIVNGMYMEVINRSIIKEHDLHNRVIRGRKTFFNGLEADILKIENMPNVNPTTVVDVENLLEIPYAVFNNLSIEDGLYIYKINNIDFTKFLTEILYCEYPDEQILNGKFHFSNLHVNGNITTSSINDIPIDDIVTDESVQNITGIKRFMGDVQVNADILLDSLNGYNLSKYYEEAIFVDEDVVIESNLVFNNYCQIGGNITTKNINGMPVEHIKNVLKVEKPKIEMEWVLENLKETEDVLLENFNLIQGMPSKFLYLENSEDFQISVSNSVEAEPYSLDGNTMLSVTYEISSDFCNLPPICLCLEQQTYYLSPHNSVNIVPSKALERVYAYDDDLSTIYIVTKSISTNTLCRVPKDKNENTTVIWTVKFNNKVETLNFKDIISGYVYSVKYFSLHGNTYAIVCTTFNVYGSEYDGKCYVYRFFSPQRKMQLIQTINNNIGNPISLSTSNQEVLFIVCNQDMTFKNNDRNIEIYKFNFQKQMFILSYKIMGTHTVSITTIYTGDGNFVALGEKTGILKMYHHNPKYDSYDLFQTHMLGSYVEDVSHFYLEGLGVRDGFLTAVTKMNNFYIYKYGYIEGWIPVSHGKLKGLRGFVPFNVKNKQYLLALSSENSTLISIVKQSPN